VLILQIPATTRSKWRIVITADANEADTSQWIVAALKRGQTIYSIEAMQRSSGEVFEIIEVSSDDAPELLRTFEEFKMKWMLYALELKLPLEVDQDIQEWLTELT